MKIEHIIAETLNIDINTITDETSPQTCANWTSLKHLILIKQISKCYGINLSISEIKTLRSVGNIKKFLADKGVEND